MNPRAAINDLHPFQGCPFGQLGYFSKLLESLWDAPTRYEIRRLFNREFYYTRTMRKMQVLFSIISTWTCGSRYSPVNVHSCSIVQQQAAAHRQ